MPNQTDNQTGSQTTLMTKPTDITRRNLLRLGTFAATGSLLTRFQPAMAGPFTGADF